MTLECINREDLPAPSTYTHGRALDAAGARPDEVVKTTIFVVGHRREQLPVIEQCRVALFGDHKPADTIAVIDTDGGR